MNELVNSIKNGNDYVNNERVKRINFIWQMIYIIIYYAVS